MSSDHSCSAVLQPHHGGHGRFYGLYELPLFAHLMLHHCDQRQTDVPDANVRRPS